MGTILRVTIGLAVAAAGLTSLTYGIAQAIEIGSCGTDEYGNSLGQPCPDGFGPMVVLMIAGTFAAIVGAAIAGALLRFIAALFVAVGAGVVLGIVDLHADDTRPGLEVVAAVAAPMVLFVLPGVGRRRRRGMISVSMAGQTQAQTPAPEPPPAAATFGSPPPWQPRATTEQAEDVAARLRQLEQLKDSGLLDEAAYDEQRRRILADL